MLFLGTTFFSAKNSADRTPSAVDDINYLRLKAGIYDNLFISKNPDFDLNNKDDWDFDTVLHARFKDSLNAGNVDWTLDTIDSVFIKRRKKGNYNWVYLFEIPIDELEDFNFERYDDYVASRQEYEYAIVPKLNNVEGNYNVNSVYAEFQGIFVVAKDRIFNTVLEPEVQTQKNHSISVINTMNSKYPFTVSQSLNNFYSGTASGVFVEVDKNGCKFLFEDSYKYRHEFLEFLANGRAKILKLWDGRIWMVVVSDNPVENQDSNTLKFTTSFGWTEIGDTESNHDLYNNGFTDVSYFRGE